RGDEVFFLTGTDEHGLKVDQAAEAQGVSPLELAARNAERFRAAWAELGISNDDFIRTTEPRHHRAAQAFLQAIYDNGHIELGTYEGLYCVACEAYYNQDELIDGNCPVHGIPVQLMKEQNYFFKLSSFQQQLLDWYDANPDAVLPPSRRNEALGFIRQGLQDISITRTSLSWGVPVPWDPAHVFYVWYDALINYASGIGYGADPERFARWWPVVHHLIGKDIVRFHCVWWPAMCMAAGIEPPHQVLVHGWLLVGGEKMSKTRFNQIYPHDLVADFGVDAVRYHLLRDTALGSDGDFSYEGMTGRYNADLANNLGNLFSRVATVVASKCEGIGPAPRQQGESRLAAVAEGATKAAAEAWDRFAPQEALEAAWRLIRETNAELEASEPWKAEPGPAVQAVLGDALEALRLVVLLALPAMPGACGELWRRMGLPGSPSEQRVPTALDWGGYPGGLPVERGAPLFPRRRE
ncbi:MAG: methionine--tRNA ligase, partial [Acidimicrobiales bacterium]|nr:methionine--tRNA ligase [Acidimicrobiales bacterium]